MIYCPTHRLLLFQSILQEIRINPLASHIKEPRGQFHPLSLIIAILHSLQLDDLGDLLLDFFSSPGETGSYIVSAQFLVSILLIYALFRGRRLPKFF